MSGRHFLGKTFENHSDTVELCMYSGRAGRGCFRLRLRNISQSNKPVIRLRTIRKMKNSLRSDNFIFLINAASQALTLSNIPPQSPAASPPRPFRKVHHISCIRLIFCVHPIRSVSPITTNLQKTGRKDELLSTTFPFQPVSLTSGFIGLTAGFDKAENGWR